MCSYFFCKDYNNQKGRPSAITGLGLTGSSGLFASNTIVGDGSDVCAGWLPIAWPATAPGPRENPTPNTGTLCPRTYRYYWRVRSLNYARVVWRHWHCWCEVVLSWRVRNDGWRLFRRIQLFLCRKSSDTYILVWERPREFAKEKANEMFLKLCTKFEKNWEIMHELCDMQIYE